MITKYLAILALTAVSVIAAAACDETDSSQSAPAGSPPPAAANYGDDGSTPVIIRTDGKPTVGIGGDGPGSLYIDPIHGGVGIDLGGGIGMPIG